MQSIKKKQSAIDKKNNKLSSDDDFVEHRMSSDED